MSEEGIVMLYVLEEKIKRNLIDIGCNQEQIMSFMEDYKNNNLKNMLNFLRFERLQILDGIHKEQKKIDYLDYLVYVLKKEGKE